MNRSNISSKIFKLSHSYIRFYSFSNLVDDSCPTITGEYYSKRKSYEDDFFSIDDNKHNLQFDEIETDIVSLLSENHNLIEILSKHREQYEEIYFFFNNKNSQLISDQILN